MFILRNVFFNHILNVIIDVDDNLATWREPQGISRDCVELAIIGSDDGFLPAPKVNWVNFQTYCWNKN